MCIRDSHYGLEKVKERVLEFLAVRKLTKKGDSPILCLVGPPGTGKTSIARSVARALDKQYVRICLGGCLLYTSARFSRLLRKPF